MPKIFSLGGKTASFNVFRHNFPTPSVNFLQQLRNNAAG